MRASSGVVFLLGRTAAARHQVGIDRQHREPRIDQRFDQHTVAGFQYDADLGRLGVKLHTARHQLSHSRCRMLDTELLDHTLTGPAQRHIMKFGPIDTYSKQMSCLPIVSSCTNRC